MDERRKHGWPFWFAIVVIAIPFLCVASFGPVCWWFLPHRIARGDEPIIVRYRSAPPEVPPFAPGVYWLLGRLADGGPMPVRMATRWYATVGTGAVFLPTRLDGSRAIIVYRQ